MTQNQIIITVFENATSKVSLFSFTITENDGENESQNVINSLHSKGYILQVNTWRISKAVSSKWLGKMQHEKQKHIAGTVYLALK